MEAVRPDDGSPRFLGYLQNISATGLFVQCGLPRPTGTQLVLRMRLPGGGEPLEEVEAEVVWTRGYLGRNGPSPGMGLRFLRVGRQVRAEIRKFCAGSDPRLHPVVEVTEVSEGAASAR